MFRFIRFSLFWRNEVTKKMREIKKLTKSDLWKIYNLMKFSLRLEDSGDLDEFSGQLPRFWQCTYNFFLWFFLLIFSCFIASAPSLLNFIFLKRKCLVHGLMMYDNWMHGVNENLRIWTNIVKFCLLMQGSYFCIDFCLTFEYDTWNTIS